MNFTQVCPSLKVHKLHAKKLQRNLGLSLGTARTIVAHMYDSHCWEQLRKRCGQQFNATMYQLPMYYLETSKIDLFKKLIEIYLIELKAVFNINLHLPEGLLALIVTNKLSAVEHYQIEMILQDFEESEGTSEDFIDAILRADNTAYKAVRNQWPTKPLKNSRNGHRNLWLNTATFQQNFYAYFHIEDNHIHIRVHEWDTGLCIPKSKTTVVNKGWFVDFMSGYISMLAQQFIRLGYIPTFEFFKIQHVYLSNLTLECNNPEHPNHGIYQLYQRLMISGGEQNEELVLNRISEERGVKISFNDNITLMTKRSCL